ncbi:MAG: MFS transporter [Bryobacterales bacterium]|nr:MFS transporter [Bryobacterales bacterium]
MWPRRVDAALLCFTANLIAHGDRVCLAVAIPAIMSQYGWDTAQAGWILSGFFLGYTLCMIPVGLLVERVGPRRLFAACIAVWSLVTLLTPLPRSIPALTALRILLGVGESGTASCINSTLIRWFQPHEYARAVGLAWSGGYAAPMLAFPLAALILNQWGWPAIFYVFGSFGFLWLPFWLRLPELPLPPAPGPRRPTRDLLLSAPVLAVFLLHFSQNWVLYMMITWLPTYLSVERQFSLPAMAAGASLPFAFAWLGTNTFAWAIDRSTPRLGRTRARKLFLLPYALAAASIFLIPSAPTPTLTVVVLCAAMALLGSASPTFSTASLDLAPQCAGALAAIQNAFANLAGIAAPVTVGYLAKSYGWHAPFWLTAAIALFGITAYLRYGRAELH